MSELVFIKQDDAFTNTYIISQNVGYAHKDITSHVIKHKKRFNKMGGTYYAANVKSNGGRPIKPIALNEQQAFFLMTLLDNASEIVLDFKMTLAVEFVRVKRLLLEKQTADWQQARLQGKEIRRGETDAIKGLIELAKEQGSKNYGMLYMTYSKLVKALVGYSDRDNATTDMLVEIMLFERTLDGIIAKEVAANTFYKAIYQKAKQELTRLKLYWSRPQLNDSPGDTA